MKYCNVKRTNIPFEMAYTKCKLIQADRDLKIGDIIYDCIVTSTGNPIILERDILPDYDNYFLSGMYVNVFPLKYIDMIESDNGDLNIEGFTVYKDERTFYPLIGFDVNGNEIADIDKTKEYIRCTYYYVRIL